MKTERHTSRELKPEGKREKAAERRTVPGWLQDSVLPAAGIGTAALGLCALLGWILGLPLLASFGADLIPMAPSTAVLFLLYGVAVTVRARRLLSGRLCQISVAVGCLGMLCSLLLFVLGCLDVQLSVEHLGLNITGTLRGAPLGHMSPVTAFVFLLASLSFLASLAPSAIRPWRAALASGATVMLLGTCFMFLLAYLYGVPLLYGGAFIPPALNTILAFTMLGLALLKLASYGDGPPGRPRGSTSKAGNPFFLIFVLLAMGIIAAAYIYYRQYEKRFVAEKGNQLAAIADLKVGELVRWRRDRIDDAAIFFKNPSFSLLVRRLFEQPADADAQRQILDWLGKYSKIDDYDQVRLMDVQNVTRMSIPAGLNPARSNTVRAASESLRSGQITLLDFYREEHDQRVHLAVLIPILHESDTSRPLGVLVLRIVPESFLFPFIRRWPTPSLTAETLLVRKDGNEVVFLNELRFQSNTALNLRAPLDRVAMPAVQAALGREGVMDGVDYRGVPVVAALQAIPDSPWVLVARMDTVEVYAPARERLWQMMMLVSILLCGAGAAVWLGWERQRGRFHRERAEAGEVLRASELRYRRLFESAKDGILILDAETGMVVDVNPFLIQLLGFSREAFLGKEIWELGFFKDIVANKDHFAELQQQEYIRYEDKPLKTADGRRIDVEFISNVYLVNRHKVIQCNIRDITERKRAEDAVRASEQEFRTLAESMPQIVWVTRADGWNIYFNQQWMDYTGLTLAESYGHGWNTPFHPDDKQRAWDAWQRATQHNDTYSVECRLRRADGVYRWWLIRGVPLRNASGTILKWFGTCTDIDGIKRAGEELARSEESLRMAQHLAHIGSWDWDALTDTIWWSEEYCRIYGYDPNQPTPNYVEHLKAYTPESVQRLDGVVKRAMETGESYEIELELAQPTPAAQWIIARGEAKREVSGKIRGLRGTAQNITERKRVEEHVARLNLQNELILSSTAQGILGLDLQGKHTFVNPAAAKMLGYESEELLGRPSHSTWHHTKPDGRPYPREECQINGAYWDGVVHRESKEVFWRKDGTSFAVEYSSTPVCEQGRLSGAVVTFEDITERKRAEDSLREKEHLLSESQRLGHIGSWLWNLSGPILWSDEMYRLYEVSRETFTPTVESMISLIHPDDRPAMQAWIAACATGEAPDELEYRVNLSSGTIRFLMGRGEAVRDIENRLTHMAGTVQDITDRKRAEAEQKELQAQLLQSQKLESIGTLAGGVAHEINNPVMGIMNYAQLIVDQLGPDSPVTEYATEIGKETQRVTTIVKNLLSFARVDKDTHKSPAGMCDIVEETLSLIRAVMRHDQITLEVNVPADLPKILCRSQQIRQVIMNLLTNARDALNQKYPGHDENKKVIISAREELIGEESSVTASGKRWVRLTVEDHGPGIPEELRERIFNPFFSTKARHKGTGLGLSISHGIVTDHGGKLSVESDVGQWTRFHVDLPVEKGVEA